MRHNLFLLLCILTLFLWSCNDKLSNGSAEQIIKERYHFPVIEDEMIETGLFGYGQDSLPRFYYLLQKQGMVSIEALGKGGFLIQTYRFRVTPTIAAKKFTTTGDTKPVKQGDNGENMYR